MINISVYFEKFFIKYEERYCRKHDRHKFLKHILGLFTLHIIFLVLVFIFAIALLVWGIKNMNNAQIIAGAISIPVLIVITSNSLPSFLKLIKKCKKDLKQ